MVVCQRHVLDENFADHAHPGLFQGLVNGEIVKIRHDLGAKGLIIPGAVGTGELGDADIPPLGVERVGGAGGFLVRPHPVQAAHEQVAVNAALYQILDEAGRQMEALVFLHAVGIERNHGDVAETRLFQSPADEGHIVAGPAAAAGLGHDDGQMIQVILSGKHRLHDLAHHGDGGEAGIVIDVFQPRVNGAAVVVVQHHHIVAVLLEDGL